jgi:hypothetical protein
MNLAIMPLVQVATLPRLMMRAPERLILTLPRSMPVRHFVLSIRFFFYWSVGALIASMVGYIIPYQLVAGLWFFKAISLEERSAASELFGTFLMRAKYWLKRLFLPSVLILLIGFSLAVTEVSRSQYLGVDFVGAGRQYFGPWFANRFNSVGLVAGVFPLFSIVCVVLALFFGLIRPRGLKG